MALPKRLCLLDFLNYDDCPLDKPVACSLYARCEREYRIHVAEELDVDISIVNIVFSVVRIEEFGRRRGINLPT